MNCQNPTEHHGHTISATVLELPSGKWHGSYVIEKDGAVFRRAVNVASFDSHGEAEEYTISIGCVIVDGGISGLF